MNKFKSIFMTTLSCFILSTAVMADDGTIIFRGADVTAITVAKAKDLKDESVVKLKGNIDQQLGDDKYLFKDGTGTIILDIEGKRFSQLVITPDDLVEVNGELDKEWFGDSEIEVFTIKVISPVVTEKKGFLF